MVWASLVVAMVAVGGVLRIASPTSKVRGDGWSLPSMTAAVPQSLEAIYGTEVPFDGSRWQAIVIHDSGFASDDHLEIERRHTSAPLNLNGLGHHFVIGNGTRRMADGQIHQGFRWLGQKAGAHVAGELGHSYNPVSIGICLVGDGERRGFTDAQLDALVLLVTSLMRTCGIGPDRVFLHSELCRTSSPGRLFPEARFRELISQAW